MSDEDQIRAAYERGFAAGFKAAKAESPETVAERNARAMESYGWVDDAGTRHTIGCSCSVCYT